MICKGDGCKVTSVKERSQESLAKYISWVMIMKDGLIFFSYGWQNPPFHTRQVFFPPIKKQYNLEIVPRLYVIYLGLQNTKAE